MKVELEFNTKLTDMPDILQKISEMVKYDKANYIFALVKI